MKQQLTKERLMIHGSMLVFLICFMWYMQIGFLQALFLFCMFTFYDLVYLSNTIINSMKTESTHVKLEGKRVVITGGSSGIGFALAKLFVKEGVSKLVLVARNEARLKQCVEELKSLTVGSFDGQIITHLAMDLSNDGKLVAERFAGLGAVDVLVNCAGYSVPGEFQKLQLKDFECMMKVNYLGTVYATHAVVPSMIKNKSGQIVFLSSVGGQLGVYGFSAYSPSKYAVRGFAEVLFHELRPYDIGVSLVFPPDTETPGYENENKNKPEICRIISEQAGLWKVDNVATTILEGVKKREFLVGVGSDGYFMNALTCGCAPSSSVLDFWVQLLLMPFLRIYMLFLQNFWTNTITNEITPSD